jgi:hypothetical protein
MKSVTRSLIAAIGTFLAFYYVYWVPVAIMLEITYGRFQWMWIIRVLGSLVAAAGVAHYAWRHKSWAPQGLVGCVILGAAIMSGVGFSAGWFGPMIFDPGSQGPLAAFITAPLGFLVGSIGGAFYWAWWGRKKESASDIPART